MSDWVWIALAAVVAVVALAAAALVVVLIIWLSRRFSRPFPDGVVTNGVVIHHELVPTGSGSDGGRMLVPVYRFVDEQGVTRVARDQIGDSGQTRVGSTVSISYRGQHPTRVRRLLEDSHGGPSEIRRRSRHAPC
ncbi:MAG: DUF3592 domain-containing protein [Ilumatobacter sp.]